MGTAFDQFPQYAFGAYPGQLLDKNHADIVTRRALGSDIGYGLAVSDDNLYDASLVDSDYIYPTGITVRETVRDNQASGPAVYPEDSEMTVLRVGRIWVRVSDGCQAGQLVYVDQSDGSLVSTSGGNVQFEGATFKTDASAGELAVVQLDGTAGALPPL